MQCTLQPGQGAVPGVITVAGQSSSFNFAYAAPTLTKVQGCASNTATATSGCNPAGGDTLMLVRESFWLLMLISACLDRNQLWQ